MSPYVFYQKRKRGVSIIGKPSLHLVSRARHSVEIPGPGLSGSRDI